MLHFSAVLIAFLVAGIATAAPTQFNKRIDQQTSLAPQPWEAACVSFHPSRLQFIIQLTLFFGFRKRQEVVINAIR